MTLIDAAKIKTVSDGSAFTDQDTLCKNILTPFLNTVMVNRYAIAPVLGTTTYVHAAIPLTASSFDVYTSITNPDVPRTISITGNAAGNAGNVVITGTNIADQVITETLAINGTTTVNSTKAFKTVTNINVPIQTHGGDTLAVGVAGKYGLPCIVRTANLLIVYNFNGAIDTGGTLAVDATYIEKNLYTPAGVVDGVKLLELYFLA